MKSESDWKIERWEDEDFIITGFDVQHSGTYSRREAEEILIFLKIATSAIQADALKWALDQIAPRGSFTISAKLEELEQ